MTISVTASYSLKKIRKWNTCWSIFNSSSYTSKSYRTLPRRHTFVSNIAWFTELFPKEKFKRCGYSNNTKKNTWHFPLIISVINKWVWLAQTLNYGTTLCKMHLSHLKRSQTHIYLTSTVKHYTKHIQVASNYNASPCMAIQIYSTTDAKLYKIAPL